MTTFRHILFPVDFSLGSHEAAPFVAAMARQMGARITALTVVEISPNLYGGLEFGAAAIIDIPEMKKAARAELHKFVHAELHNLDVRLAVEQGLAGASITEYARANGVDLITMPTQGSGPFRRMLLGSVTAKVLHDAKCAVWTAAHLDKIPLQHLQCESLMCAIDLSLDSVPLIKNAATLGRHFGAKVRLIHALPGLGSRPELYFDLEFHRFLTGTAREEIRKLQDEAGTNFDVCMEGGDVSKVIHGAAMHHDADLVMIGRGHAQNSFGQLRSNTYAIIRDAPCPVLSM